jgi:hypothetical protein
MCTPGHRTASLEEVAAAVHALYLFVSNHQLKPSERKVPMENDPLSEIAAAQAAYQTLLKTAQDLSAALAAAQAANPASDFVTPDVQAALANLNSVISSAQVPADPGAPAATTSAPAPASGS